MYCSRVRYILLVLLGYLLFKDFCENMSEEPVPQMSFYDEVSFTTYGMVLGNTVD